MAKILAMVFGAIFILVGLLGFVNNPVVGSHGFFETNVAHNIVHILLGLGLMVFGKNKPSATLKVVAVVYVFVAILGFVMGEGKLLGIVHINSADNWLHLVVAVALFAASLVSEPSSGYPPMPTQPQQ